MTTATALPKAPREVLVDATTLGLAPAFRRAVELTVRDVRAAGFRIRIFETIRTDERQRFLHGFGRLYDDGRGIVTHSMTARKTWHYYGLAADLVEDDETPWKAPPEFWNTYGRIAERHGLTWGGRWQFLDLPHCQWGRCRRSPSEATSALYDRVGMRGIWKAVGAAA